MMQRKTELLQVQPTLEILLALPLVVGPPLPFLENFWPQCWTLTTLRAPSLPYLVDMFCFLSHGRPDAPPSEAPLGKYLSSPG